MLSPALAFLLLAGSAAATAVGQEGDSGQTSSDSEAMPAREESHQIYDLEPGSTVRVTGIAGPVLIETGSGDYAEVDILRMAATERELQCYRTEVSASADSLTIRHVQSRERSCNSIRSRQEVRLRLPPSVNIDLSTIAGRVEIGPVDGMLRLESIAGRVTVARARAVEIDSLAGGLSLGVAALAPQGVRISSVVGSVDLRLERDVDADIRLDSVMGSVSSLSPAVDVVEEDGAYRARAGAGGGRISVSSVVGRVRLHRL